MITFSLSWVVGFGQSSRGGSKDDVSLDDVMNILNKVLKDSGSVTIDVINGPEIGPESLQVGSEAGLSVLSLGENDGEDYVVRTYTADSFYTQQVSILGEMWDLNLICKDQNIVKDIFKEFFLTGNVSRNLLS